MNLIAILLTAFGAAVIIRNESRPAAKRPDVPPSLYDRLAREAGGVARSN